MAKYTAKPNTRFTDKDAKIIGSFLEKKFPTGNFTPEDVVAIARPQKSPIHKYFEWDDTRAARLYRLSQARRMINCLVAIIDETPDVPQYVNIRVSESSKVYMKTEAAMKSPSIWKQVLQTALQEAESWKNRYCKFKQLSPIVSAINKVNKNINKGVHRG